MECCVSQAENHFFYVNVGAPAPRSQVLSRRTDVRLVPVLSATPPYGGHPRNAPVDVRHVLPTIKHEKAVH